MERKALTVRYLDAVRGRPGPRVEVADTVQPALVLRLGGRSKTWFV